MLSDQHADLYREVRRKPDDVHGLSTTQRPTKRTQGRAVAELDGQLGRALDRHATAHSRSPSMIRFDGSALERLATTQGLGIR
jgi:hypothetical protein